MLKKKVVVIGNGKIALDCLKILQEYDYELSIVQVFFETNDHSTPSRIKNFCSRHNINCADANSLNNQITVNEIASLNPDIIFNINNGLILSKSIIDSTKIGAVNFHNGPLPLYRGHGHAVLFWAIFNGENQYGVTWHFMEPSVDTGDIIAQKIFKIPENENALGLNFKCIIEGINLFEKVLKNLLSGNYKRSQQQGQSSRYLSKNVPNQGYIDFNWSYEKIDRFLRATDFKPYYNLFSYAKINFNSNSFIVISAKPHSLKTHSYKVGEIVDITDAYLRVAAKDSIIDITRIMTLDKNEISIKQLKHEFHIEPKALLNSNNYDDLRIAS